MHIEVTAEMREAVRNINHLHTAIKATQRPTGICLRIAKERFANLVIAAIEQQDRKHTPSP